MSTPTDIANFLVVTEGALGSGRRTRRLLLELEDHLLESVDRALAQGLPEDVAVREAILRLGTPEQLAAAVARERARTARPWLPQAALAMGFATGAAVLTQHALGPHDGFALLRMATVAITLAHLALALCESAAALIPARAR